MSACCNPPSLPPSPACGFVNSSDEDDGYASSGGEAQELYGAAAKRSRDWPTPPNRAPPPPLPSTPPPPLPEAIGDGEQAGAEFLQWLDDEAARGAELRELLQGERPAPATKLTEAELRQLAAADEAMELTAGEKQQLAKVRQKCAQLGRTGGLSPLESATRHAFKLVARGGKRFAVCLRCESRDNYEPTATAIQMRAGAAPTSSRMRDDCGRALSSLRSQRWALPSTAQLKHTAPGHERPSTSRARHGHRRLR